MLAHEQLTSHALARAKDPVPVPLLQALPEYSVGTASSNVTVPRLVLPPVTVDGKSVRLASIPAITRDFTVNQAEAALPE
jgi:hypothetical protein